ncbi:hypothetical protein [Maritalea sp. S77]|uniref:hypothetical protein n=1 Tax=Maritalea sp. S77 TaxID=3415125 RepID=UPI003C7DBFB4
MARRLEEEDNHWPGFVDALSTIVMVVTFLLIILGIVIFAISQQIATTVITADVSGKPPTEKVENDILEADTPQVAEVKPEADPVEKQPTPAQSEVGVIEPQQSDTLTQSEAIDSDNELQIQSRRIIEEKKIVVATEEENSKQTPDEVVVESAAQILTVLFKGKGLEVTDEAGAEIQTFLDENREQLRGAKLTAWGFYDPASTAQSQAKRKAYFRVLSVRNVLINSGFEGESLTINVRPATRDEEIDQVRVFVGE